MTGIKETSEVVDCAFDALDLIADFDDLNWLQIYSRVKAIRESSNRATAGIEQVPAEIRDLDDAESRQIGGQVGARAHRFVQKVRT